MMKIYTPEQWYDAFGKHPTLVIDDQGRIWSSDQYFKPLFGEPSGLIDYKKNRIYGPDYASLNAVPIARMETVNGETRIYNYRDGWSASPMLYIIGNRIYTPDQYLTAGLGGDSVGYVEQNHTHKEKEPAPTKNSGDAGFTGSAGIGAMENLGCFGFIVLVLLLGKVVDALPDFPLIVWITLAAMVVVVRALIIESNKQTGKLSWLADQLRKQGAGRWILAVLLIFAGFSILAGISMPEGFWLEVLKRLWLPALLVLGGLAYFYTRKFRR